MRPAEMTKMLHLRRFYPFALRCCWCQTWSGNDFLLNQLHECTDEDQVFDLVGKNKTNLSEKHVGMAIDILYQFQKKKPIVMRRTEYIKNHSQFLTLSILAENKIAQMDDQTLVDMLYNLLRLNVEDHASLIEQLVMELWRRLDGLSLPALSKFALSLNKQELHRSSLVGRIADIVNRNLDSIDDIRIFSILMVNISSVISLNLRDRLIQKAMFLLEIHGIVHLNHARRFVQFLCNVRLLHRPLLDKCNKVFLQNADKLHVNDIVIILQLYQSLQFTSTEFKLIVKQKMMEQMNDCYDPVSFTKLFESFAPIAGPEVREQLIETAILVADELEHWQILNIMEAMQAMGYKNSQLIKKIASLLHKHLDLYKPSELARVTYIITTLHFPYRDLYSKLQQLLIGYLQVSVRVAETALLIHALAMVPSSSMDDVVVARISAIFPQCNLLRLCSLTAAVMKWAQRDRSNKLVSSGSYGKLLQEINSYALEKLQKANNLDLLLEDLRFPSGEWFNENLFPEVAVVFQRLVDQITWENVLQLSHHLLRSQYLCTQVLDGIATVTINQPDKVFASGVYSILHPFAILNYDPPQGEEFFEACIGHINRHLDSFEPHIIVLMSLDLAITGRFPETLIKTIFNVEFLARLDNQLEMVSDSINKKMRFDLMELNRAVCLECPELQIPWFHEHYCQQLQNNSSGSSGALRQQINRLLVEALGGANFARMSVVTPYYYRFDFECILDKNKRPLPYVHHGGVMANLERVHWSHNGQVLEKKGLPPGAQRIAIEFLDSENFCKNSTHPRGKTVMRKRHLEILGYHVVQIPHFEWNSMELSSKNAWIEYLKAKIFS
uniref:FAST kinase domain-containing protein 1, mitochondrial isoform X1 n=1 Tax=Pogona vitticeps TaxID=103695 RepID=A0A6J0T974_9SAUR